MLYQHGQPPLLKKKTTDTNGSSIFGKLTFLKQGSTKKLWRTLLITVKSLYKLSLFLLQNSEQVFYAIDQINRDPRILPGVELAFNLTADCFIDRIALNEVSFWVSLFFYF